MDTKNVEDVAGVNNKARNSVSSLSEFSDCGYVTQIETQESTSSNEDDKQYHRKPPPNQKQRFNAVYNPRKTITSQDSRRKKLVKRRNGM